MKKLVSFLLASLFIVSVSKNVSADDISSCSNRYLTLVNPVRGRNLWQSQDLGAIVDQKISASKYGFPITWLLQYDVLNDKEFLEKINGFGNEDEKGLFLEVSKDFADYSGVKYSEDTKWSNPGKIFLSAYSQSERRLLIDSIYHKFKESFGYYPKSVGAWWIDSYSLNYIKNKYGLSAVLIVADQKSTDSYGVWGQWWGTPYYPSTENVLVPGNLENKLDSVVIQWAQRDPRLAYGDGSSFSNYSLQANDYLRSGKNTDYFKYLVNKYLDCRNSIGQITIGMETGMEASAFQGEYENQLKVLSEISGLKVVTMSEFYWAFKEINPENPDIVYIDDWEMNLKFRQNENLSDKINYFPGISFKDYFIADKGTFLDRNLANLEKENTDYHFPWLLVSFGVLTVSLIVNKKYSILIWVTLVGLASYGLLFRSQLKYGWGVLYGSFGQKFILVQALSAAVLIIISFILFNKRLKLPKIFIWLIPLSYSIDYVLSILAYSKIEGATFLGIFLSKVKFAGIAFGQGIHFILNRYPTNAAEAFIRIPVEKISGNLITYLFINPVIHILMACVIYLIIRKIPKKLLYYLLGVFIILLILHIDSIFKTDPSLVFPVK